MLEGFTFGRTWWSVGFDLNQAQPLRVHRDNIPGSQARRGSAATIAGRFQDPNRLVFPPVAFGFCVHKLRARPAVWGTGRADGIRGEE